MYVTDIRAKSYRKGLTGVIQGAIGNNKNILWVHFPELDKVAGKLAWGLYYFSELGVHFGDPPPPYEHKNKPATAPKPGANYPLLTSYKESTRESVQRMRDGS